MREKFQTRTFLLRSEVQVNSLLSTISNLPICAEKPIEVIVREQSKKRSNEANNYYWNRVSEIVEQGVLDGRRFGEKTWHHLFKEWFLPEIFEDGITKEGYIKYETLPNGDRLLVGSTGDLLTRGFANFTEEVEAFGSELGVHFSVRDYE